MLSDILTLFVPRGWFPPVTPGTKFVTVGGMVASDVHGKNHENAGSFCDHVETLDLVDGTGGTVTCSRTANVDLFRATCGGMGLTGVIAHVTFRMMPIETAWIKQVTRRTANLDETLKFLDAPHAMPYQVAWVDCHALGLSLGRSVLTLGDHAKLTDLTDPAQQKPLSLKPRQKLAVPCDLPGFALNAASVRLFNELYYRTHADGTKIVGLDEYFYPLDALHDWNRLYGSRGFVQYQCVMPHETGHTAIRRLLEKISAARSGSFLSVLKRLGPQNDGLLSFPRPGYTLALDFVAKPKPLELLKELDQIVMDFGGRIYLAKDARAPKSVVEAGYPQLSGFREIRQRYGLDARFQSVQSKRLGL